ncbi:MAG: hypothetical protein DRJ40_10760 [Thermoprotei archaeon]|nr:MAG: hypothetical protein DRJ40_10760 [Thermoprotei archaeon]
MGSPEFKAFLKFIKDLDTLALEEAKRIDLLDRLKPRQQREVPSLKVRIVTNQEKTPHYRFGLFLGDGKRAVSTSYEAKYTVSRLGKKIVVLSSYPQHEVRFGIYRKLSGGYTVHYNITSMILNDKGERKILPEVTWYRDLRASLKHYINYVIELFRRSSGEIHGVLQDLIHIVRPIVKTIFESDDNMYQFLAGLLDSDGTVMKSQVMLCIPVDSVEGIILALILEVLGIPYSTGEKSGETYFILPLSSTTIVQLLRKTMNYIVNPINKSRLEKELQRQHRALKILNLQDFYNFLMNVKLDSRGKLVYYCAKNTLKRQLLESLLKLHEIKADTSDVKKVRISYKRNPQNLEKLEKLYQDLGLEIPEAIKKAKQTLTQNKTLRNSN